LAERKYANAAPRGVDDAGYSSAGSAGDEEPAEPMLADPEAHLADIIGNSTP